MDVGVHLRQATPAISAHMNKSWCRPGCTSVSSPRPNPRHQILHARTCLAADVPSAQSPPAVEKCSSGAPRWCAAQLGRTRVLARGPTEAWAQGGTAAHQRWLLGVGAEACREEGRVAAETGKNGLGFGRGAALVGFVPPKLALCRQMQRMAQKRADEHSALLGQIGSPAIGAGLRV